MFKYLGPFSLSLSLSGCMIYQSPERKAFESESPTFRVQNLQKISCSQESVKIHSTQSRLITLADDQSLWEYLIENQSTYESENLKTKEYCIYEFTK